MTPAVERTLTDRLLDVVMDSRQDASDGWAALTGRALVDTVSVLVAGRDEACVTAAVATIDDTGGSARSLVTGRPMTARSAACIDGTAAHALDYDDVDDDIIAHPSAVLLPALLAVGGSVGASGSDVVDAYRAGLRVGRTLATELGIRGHYEKGWHSTSTLGTIMTAAAVARVTELSADAIRHALGIAGSMAGGSRRAFGTMLKPLHAGLASSNGVYAVALARNGLTTDPDLLGGPLGFVELHADRSRGTDYDVLDASNDVPAVDIKLYPCCYYLHSAVEAALTVRDEVDIDAIARIDVAVQPGGLAPLVHPRPTTGTQAKFSMQFAVAAAILDGRIDFATFNEARIGRPDVQDLLRRVHPTEAEIVSPDRSDARQPYAEVTTTLHDGTSRRNWVTRPLGHASRPVTDDRLRAKFDDCTSSSTAAVRNSAFAALSDIDNQPSVDRVVDLVCRLTGHRSKEIV